MASGSHKYSANEALAFILASDSDSNDSFGDESSLDSSEYKYKYYSVHAKETKKVWCKTVGLCESQSGYCLNLQIYKGKEGDNQESGLAYRVVMDLMRVYLYRNYYLFVDNYYRSSKLFLT